MSSEADILSGSVVRGPGSGESSRRGLLLVVSAPSGTGKTTVVRSLLERLPEHADVAVVLNPQLTPVEFVLTICEELGIAVPDGSENSLKDLVDLLSRHLLNAHADGKRCAVVTSTGGWLDLNTRKLIAPPDALREALAALPKVEGFQELRSSISR